MTLSTPNVHRGPDAESRRWVADLTASGSAHEAAVRRLHALLLKAARFEVARRARALGADPADSFDDLATQAAGDALVAILRRLPDYRGESRFTTWAYKFALLEAGVKLRRRAWEGREIGLEDDAWATLADWRADAEADVDTAELLGAVGEAIRTVLTPRQREVLLALALNDVPIDVLAHRTGTTRGALYKTLHDARRKLRAHLAAAGLGPDANLEGDA